MQKSIYLQPQNLKSSMAEQHEDPIVNVNEVYGKTEQFVIDNKNYISYAVLVVAAAVLGWFAFSNFIIKPKQIAANEVIWQAQRAFEQDSFKLALDGNGADVVGFLEIINVYGMTKAANLSHYYAGICYLNLGEFDAAIDHLSSFDSDDVMLSAVAIGAQGDAYAELGQMDKAIKYYLDAAKSNKNEFTSPIYLMKAGQLMEEQGDYKGAKSAYQEIKDNYSTSNEGRAIEKYLTRASAFSN